MIEDKARAEAARKLLVDRNCRYRLFPGELFDEYAWNMLLYLFVAQANDHRVSERHLIASVKTSSTIGQRWLYQLAKDGQIEPRKSGDDVVLTTGALARLREYFDTIGEQPAA
jgi:hypothetical protein